RETYDAVDAARPVVTKERSGPHRRGRALFERPAARPQRLPVLPRAPEMGPPRREDDGRWAVHVVRHGRLAAAGVIPPGADAHQYVAELRLSAETVGTAPGPVPAATAEESEKVLRWLESEGVRLVDVEGEWACPVAGAGRHRAGQGAVAGSRRSLVPFADRRDLATVHQPTR